MEYESLYEQLQPLEKEMREKLTALQKTQKSLARKSEKGELKTISKELAQLRSLMEECGALVSEYEKQAEAFDAKEYMENGDFARQVTDLCQSMSVDIRGEYPIYEIFPYRVKIDSENEELVIDRKKLVCVRPLYFVQTMKQNQAKLNKAPFNASAFLNELADAYETLILYKNKNGKSARSGDDVFLKDLYGYIVPMQRFRREYDMQSYAFDLSRLCMSDVETTKNGRHFQLGPCRLESKHIRILDKDGNERLLGTLRFFEPEQ